ncbi:hypothetical protein P7C71_g2117, partial [Lecanoromycetidae sp. Uapishka_2]
MFASRKRARDEIEEDSIQSQHASKVVKQEKQRTLPFRCSPNTKHIRPFSRSPRTRPTPLFTQTVTPADSEEEENSPPFASSHETQPEHSSQLATNIIADSGNSYDSDMDMMDSQPMASPRPWAYQVSMQTPHTSPCTIAPPQPVFRESCSGTSNSAFGGRLPTPIYGYFQQSIDLKMDTSENEETLLPRSQNEIEYGMYARRRRLPTPIDEDEPMDAPTSPPMLSEAMFRRFAIGNDSHCNRQSPTQTTSGFAASPRGARLSFSMGVRADCESCRNKVPGHSNHIFRS